MGRTILCPHCKSTFNEDILKLREDENICPVCSNLLDDGADAALDDIPTEEELTNPDLYFYVIDPEDTHEDKRYGVRKVWCDCTSCQTIRKIPYDSFDFISKKYLRLQEGLGLSCEGCGKEFTKLIVPQRPEGWIRPTPEEIALEHKPKCPTCGSDNIKKISATSKAASVAMWGLLSRKVHKQWHCNHCGSEW